MIKVVIAEDDYRIGDIHEKFIHKVPGFQVVAKALNGEDTLSAIHETKPDLLLLDIYMPDILGSKLLKKIRHQQLEVDVIIISAATEKDIVEKSIRYGAIDYILKPVEMKRFITTMKRYKQWKDSLQSGDINQEMLNHYFGHYHPDTPIQQETPKGIDPLTLEKVTHAMKDYVTEGVTAEELGKNIGVTRTTARRYLEYLISQKKITAELEYGSVGRPERKYFSFD